MAATTGTALKQLIEGGGLSLDAYRDAAPTGAKAPFVVVTDGITIVPDRDGDGAGMSGDTAVENVQVDLWEPYIDDTDVTAPVIAEDYTLAPRLLDLLHGASLPMAPFHVYAVRVGLSTRTRDTDANLVRTRYSVNLYRRIA